MIDQSWEHDNAGRVILELMTERDRLREALTCIRDTFAKDIAQGYRTKDKEFAVDIANLALKGASS